MRSPQALTDALHARGQRVTPQRQLLFRLLHENDSHPTADSLFALASERMPGISLRTVYQTLSELVQLGEVQPLDVGTGPARFDPNIGEHHHLVCDSCGLVRDVQLDGPTPAPEQTTLEGFTTQAAHVLFRGLCATCQGSAVHDVNTPNNRPNKQGVTDA